MTYQRVLLRLFSSRLLGCAGARFLRNRVWTIENGEGAGLNIGFPQNPDYISGVSERPVQEALSRQLRPGDVFYDVGANVGFFSLIAAKLVGPRGFVYSFEPVVENVASIRSNTNINQLENIKSFEVAVGQTSGTAEMLLTEWDGGATLSTSVVKTSEPVSRRNVRVVALDDFIQDEGLRLPTLVKIDVEGLELDVIQGMSKTIAKTKPVLLLEIDDGDFDAFCRRRQELDQFIASFGYRILHLAESYPNMKWNVGHTLALPCESLDAP